MSYKDPQRLHELYHDEGLSTPQIAERFDVTAPTIHRWLMKHDIETRSPPEGKRKRHSRQPVPFKTRRDDGYERWDNGQRVVLVHRLQAVALFGFDAVAGNHIHHRNSIPWDNRPENLEVLSASDHHSTHAQDQDREPTGEFS